MSAAFKIYFCLAVIGSVLVLTSIKLDDPVRANGTNHFDDEYITWAVGDTNVHPPQPRLMCPQGKFIKSVWIKQNEWLARVKIFCAGASERFLTGNKKEDYKNAELNQSAAAENQPYGTGTPGPEAGGNGGTNSHGISIGCPETYVVDGITGLNTRVTRPYGNEYFAADPHFFCGSSNAAAIAG